MSLVPVDSGGDRLLLSAAGVLFSQKWRFLCTVYVVYIAAGKKRIIDMEQGEISRDPKYCQDSRVVLAIVRVLSFQALTGH